MRAVIFDRDNTLLYFDTAAVDALDQRIKTITPSLSTEVVTVAWRLWSNGWPRTEEEEPAFWRRFWAVLAKQHQLSREQAAELQRIGGFYHTCFAAFPDAAECLATLHARDWKLALLTNFELPSVHRTLQHAGLNPELFSALLSSAAVGWHKPDPRAYLAASETLRVPPDACVFVDDLPRNVEAARAVGMYGVVIARTPRQDDPRFPWVADLRELGGLLEQLRTDTP